MGLVWTKLSQPGEGSLEQVISTIVGIYTVSKPEHQTDFLSFNVVCQGFPVTYDLLHRRCFVFVLIAL